MPAVLDRPMDTEATAEMTRPDLDFNEIERRAYFRYLDRGCGDGLALDDWIAAETEVRQETVPAPMAKS